MSADNLSAYALALDCLSAEEVVRHEYFTSGAIEGAKLMRRAHGIARAEYEAMRILVCAYEIAEAAAARKAREEQHTDG